MSDDQARPASLSLNQRLLRSGAITTRSRRRSFDAHNNDRIVVMPGVYSEPHSRKQPTHDPKCQKYLTDTGLRRRRARRPLLPLPVPLPQRPGADQRPRPQARPRRTAAAARPTAHGIPDLGPVHPLQPPDRGIGPVAPRTS